MPKRHPDPRKFFSTEETQSFEQAIRDAEHKTSAEIKLVVVRHSWDNIRRKAVHTFKKLHLFETQERNAVLIMLVTANHEFVIYGDQGIYQKAGPNFWTDVTKEMTAAFKEDRFGDGLVQGIGLIGDKLAEHFPRRDDDQNEVPDKVDYDD